ncbi:hypothetical protein HanXRQr2_Chr10g0453801 [Helianthus annuus]|uniref:Uncharacterized protein n=1 Tax=Helianthus annuus TaxID=4232 RepID=A0A251TMZ6_HELAN|nr:hypothetical protein HanXRQr2_Chr10g0453801 [Helianthus annuus]KAJ0884794.1 hypothetical protein HanPSC8_Chr10g0437991 [Helianthus annuus]
MIQFLHSCFNSCSIDSLQRLLHLPLYNRTPVVSISQTKSNLGFEDMGWSYRMDFMFPVFYVTPRSRHIISIIYE